MMTIQTFNLFLPNSFLVLLGPSLSFEFMIFYFYPENSVTNIHSSGYKQAQIKKKKVQNFCSKNIGASRILLPICCSYDNLTTRALKKLAAFMISYLEHFLLTVPAGSCSLPVTC